MARKHGFRGTPVRPPRTPGNMGRMFDNRGDPMVSPKEGQERFGRNIETENPDFDRYFAENAAREKAAQILKPSQVDTTNAFRKALVKQPSLQQKAANIVLAMEKGMRSATVNVKERVSPDKPAKGNFYLFTPTDAPLPKLKPKKGRKKK